MTEFRDRVADTCAEVLFEIELYHKSGGDTGPIDRIADSVNALWASFSRDEGQGGASLLPSPARSRPVRA
jgi:hypothetical protein